MSTRDALDIGHLIAIPYVYIHFYNLLAPHFIHLKSETKMIFMSLHQNGLDLILFFFCAFLFSVAVNFSQIYLFDLATLD